MSAGTASAVRWRRPRGSRPSSASSILRRLLRRCAATSARCVSTRQSFPLCCLSRLHCALRCRTVRCAHSDCSPAYSLLQVLIPVVRLITVRWSTVIGGDAAPVRDANAAAAAARHRVADDGCTNRRLEDEVRAGRQLALVIDQRTFVPFECHMGSLVYFKLAGPHLH